MAKKIPTKGAGGKIRVTILNEVRLDEFSLILRPGDRVKLSPAMLKDPRVSGNYNEKA